MVLDQGTWGVPSVGDLVCQGHSILPVSLPDAVGRTSLISGTAFSIHLTKFRASGFVIPFTSGPCLPKQDFHPPGLAPFV